VNWLDRALQRWRIRKASRYIPRGARVLDVGCFDGALFRILAGRTGQSVGIDPLAPQDGKINGALLIRGTFPDDLPACEPFDVLVALAIVEHLPPGSGPPFVEACAQVLQPGGLVVLTIPSPAVDTILRSLQQLHVLHGMSVEDHHGFTAAVADALFTSHGFARVCRKKFQFGLNNLLVFRKQG